MRIDYDTLAHVARKERELQRLRRQRFFYKYEITHELTDEQEKFMRGVGATIEQIEEEISELKQQAYLTE